MYEEIETKRQVSWAILDGSLVLDEKKQVYSDVMHFDHNSVLLLYARHYH